MSKITLIRHGQASFGKANYDQLSPLGYEQGRVLGEWFKRCEIQPTQIITGTLARHKQTAESCMAALRDETPNSDWQSDSGFNEYDHVQMIFLHEPRFRDPAYVRELFSADKNPQKKFQELFVAAFARWMSGQHDDEYKESWPDFRRRCVAALERILQKEESGQQVFVFTSGGPITAICQYLLGVPDTQIADLNASFANASMTEVLYQPGRVSLSTMNSYAHFQAYKDKNMVSYR